MILWSLFPFCPTYWQPGEYRFVFVLFNSYQSSWNVSIGLRMNPQIPRVTIHSLISQGLCRFASEACCASTENLRMWGINFTCLVCACVVSSVSKSFQTPQKGSVNNKWVEPFGDLCLSWLEIFISYYHDRRPFIGGTRNYRSSPMVSSNKDIFSELIVHVLRTKISLLYKC